MISSSKSGIHRLSPTEGRANNVALAIFLMVAFAAMLLSGCTREEKVLDIETPRGDIEVYQEKPITE